MDKNWWLGIVAAAAISVIATFGAILVFAGDKYVEDIAIVTVEKNRVITKDEADRLRSDVASMRATLDQIATVQNKMLDAILSTGQ